MGHQHRAKKLKNWARNKGIREEWQKAQNTYKDQPDVGVVYAGDNAIFGKPVFICDVNHLTSEANEFIEHGKNKGDLVFEIFFNIVPDNEFVHFDYYDEIGNMPSDIMWGGTLPVFLMKIKYEIDDLSATFKEFEVVEHPDFVDHNMPVDIDNRKSAFKFRKTLIDALENKVDYPSFNSHKWAPDPTKNLYDHLVQEVFNGGGWTNELGIHIEDIADIIRKQSINTFYKPHNVRADKYGNRKFEKASFSTYLDARRKLKRLGHYDRAINMEDHFFNRLHDKCKEFGIHKVWFNRPAGQDWRGNTYEGESGTIECALNVYLDDWIFDSIRDEINGGTIYLSFSVFGVPNKNNDIVKLKSIFDNENQNYFRIHSFTIVLKKDEESPYPKFDIEKAYANYDNSEEEYGTIDRRGGNAVKKSLLAYMTEDSGYPIWREMHKENGEWIKTSSYKLFDEVIKQIPGVEISDIKEYLSKMSGNHFFRTKFN